MITAVFGRIPTIFGRKNEIFFFIFFPISAKLRRINAVLGEFLRFLGEKLNFFLIITHKNIMFIIKFITKKSISLCYLFIFIFIIHFIHIFQS